MSNLIGIGYFVAMPNDLTGVEQELSQLAKATGEILSRKRVGTDPSPGGRTSSEETKRKQSIAKTKIYKFKAPSNEIVVTQGLGPLCEKYGLTASELSRLHQGKIRQHKHWTKA